MVLLRLKESAKHTVSVFFVREGKEEWEFFLGIQRPRVSRRIFFGFPCSFRVVTVGTLRCFVYLNVHFINKSPCFIHDIFVIYLDA